MLNLIGQRIKRFKLNSVRLDGSVPQKKRQQLVHQFQHDPTCRLFLCNQREARRDSICRRGHEYGRQCGSCPGIRRCSKAAASPRAHRMGQRNPVQVYLLVTEQTIEEKLLGTLASRK